MTFLPSLGIIFLTFLYFLEGTPLKKLHDAVDRFAYTHPRFGIPGLIRYIVFGTAIVYLLLQFSSYSAISFLTFNWAMVLQGELWRLVTFIFVPGSTSPLWLLLSLYFTYFIGTLLEREWGTAKFNLYYFSGVVLTILTGIISHYAFGYSVIHGTYYVGSAILNSLLGMNLAREIVLINLNREQALGVKVKWIALVDVALFLLEILGALARLDLFGALLPVVALLNFLVFFWTDLVSALGYQRSRSRHQHSHQTIQFKSAVRAQRQKEADRGYRHKCAVCGRTDTDFPELEFRYCSRCAGYHCFCADHIFNHEHFTQ